MGDAFLLIGSAMPGALKSGQPGTPAFRTGLRDAMEHVHFTGAQGPFAMTPTDHTGSDKHLLVLTEVKDSAWRLIQ